jgi:predicted AlkP superfamily pyrophosphatase or phosphodiesterase
MNASPMRVLFLVCDGLSPRHVDPEVMPVLAALAEEGGWCHEGGIAVMPTSTYPNHATFVTGVVPSRHGITANHIPTEGGVVSPWEVGPSSPTLFDSMQAGGRRSAAVFGDHHLVGTMGARRADFLWPDGDFADGIDLDVLGYAKDPETAKRILEAVDDGAELVVAQLNEPDTAAHLFGPDHRKALSCYGGTDTQVGVVLSALREEWERWVVIVVSDHSQEAVVEPAPIDLHAVAEQLGMKGVVVDDGAAAVVWGELGRSDAWLRDVPGVDDTRRIDADTVLVWSTGGRWFSPMELPVRGVHGSPRTAPQVAVVSGGHPGARPLAEAIGQRRPPAESWAPAIAELLSIPAPADLEPGATKH